MLWSGGIPRGRLFASLNGAVVTSLQLIVAPCDRDPAFDASLVARKSEGADARGNVTRCIVAPLPFDGERLRPVFLFRRHSSVGAVGVERGLFQGSLVRSMAINSSGKQRSWKPTISSKLPCSH